MERFSISGPRGGASIRLVHLLKPKADPSRISASKGRSGTTGGTGRRADEQHLAARYDARARASQGCRRRPLLRSLMFGRFNGPRPRQTPVAKVRPEESRAASNQNQGRLRPRTLDKLSYNNSLTKSLQAIVPSFPVLLIQGVNLRFPSFTCLWTFWRWQENTRRGSSALRSTIR